MLMFERIVGGEGEFVQHQVVREGLGGFVGVGKDLDSGADFLVFRCGCH